MAVRRVRILLAVVAVWIIGSWWYTWGLPDGYRSSPLHPSLDDDSLLFEEGLDDVRWSKRPTQYPVGKLIELPTPNPAVKIPDIQAKRPEEDAAAKTTRSKRLAAVKASFKHSWDGYKRNAWLKDEIKPISGDYKNPFGGWAATLVDSLDSLWIMDMKTDFEQSVSACEQIDFSKTMAKDINVFETTIRYLGGFTAAYELSEKQYPTLLAKAVEVGELLMSAFDTPNRMPIARWNWRDYVKGKVQKASHSTLVSEIGSLSLEFSKLSQLTGDLQYHDAAQRISNEVERGQSRTSIPGLWPVVLDASTGHLEFSGDSYTLGGMSDSLYEYFPKQYLLLGGALEQPRKLYEGFINVAKQYLFRRALNPGNLPIIFPGDAQVKYPDGEYSIFTTPRAQHLTCFVGGMVGLAAKAFDRPADLEIAKQITDGCVWSYKVTKTGIGPEIFSYIPCDLDPAKDDCKWSERRWLDSLKEHWRPSESGVTDAQIKEIIKFRRLPEGVLAVNDPKYILRPEAIESVFLMYRFTGDPTWMDKAWEMFTAIEKYTRTPFAAASLDDITKEKPVQVDSMESFWLAETLKYFYLVFSDWDVIDLNKWVLNTEAHPLRRADAI